jgi:hypothetical protein
MLKARQFVMTGLLRKRSFAHCRMFIFQVPTVRTLSWRRDKICHSRDLPYPRVLRCKGDINSNLRAES